MVHGQIDLRRLQSERAQSFVGDGLRAEIRSLAVILPTVEERDTGGCELYGGGGAVRTIQTASVDAEREADAARFLRRGEFLAALLGFFPLRTQFLEHTLQAVHIGCLAGGSGIRGPIDVAETEIERIDAHLLISRERRAA